MAQRVYATASDYYAFVGEATPTGTDDAMNARLRRSSSVIDSHTRNDTYDVDEDGYPTSLAIADAFRDATCAQADWFTETDDLTGALTQDGSVSIGSVSIGARGRTAGSGAPDPGVSRMSPEAVEILRNVGLMRNSTSHT